MYSLMFIYFFSLISVIICIKPRTNMMRLATWNIGLEEQLAYERTSSIIKAIREKNIDILCLQDVCGDPQILRQIYQSVKDIYPYFQVVNDGMRDYISRDDLPTQTCSPVCLATHITNAQICVYKYCSNVADTQRFICAMTKCPTETLFLYTNSKCWACIFDRFINCGDPLGLNYCGAVKLPQLISTSPAKQRYPLKKLAAKLYSKIGIAPRGYIIVSQEDKQLIIANIHVAAVDISFPYAHTETFLNSTCCSWNDENKGQTIELESVVWNFLCKNKRKYKNAIMSGDFNMRITNFKHHVSAIQPDDWNYMHQLHGINGSTRWYDDYTEMHGLCTRCTDNLVLPFPNNYIYDHIFTYGDLFNPSKLSTQRIFDDPIKINSRNKTIITNLSDHYGIELITTY
ncbi:unnamed protein product [Rotaria sordida]|uniref:Endonuclease/exonuclease/phosphatase domain-containing protein n=1 Tax=Rotaria sordida TaxID=392033 RepID=A0A814TC13_9BILA|nr:unnamed protein product [Rotaria sordida]